MRRAQPGVHRGRRSAGAHVFRCLKASTGTLALSCFLCVVADARDDRLEPVVEVVATGLEIPWALAFTPDHRLFITERPGRVRVVANGRLLPKPWAEFPVAQTGIAGLTGMALAPDFDSSRQAYFYAVLPVPNQDDSFFSRIYRLTEKNGKGVEQTIILDNLPAYDTHSGGALAFGDDGMLYIATGDAERLHLVQDTASLTGKILRVRRDGSVPDDNPKEGSPVLAVGLRNTQGFAWHPVTRQLFATEHGPSGFPGESGRRNQDELNVIGPGENYGWPIVAGVHGYRYFTDPIADWTPGIAPSGIAFFIGGGSAWHHNLFVGAMRGQHLRRIELERSNRDSRLWQIVAEHRLFEKEFGRIRGVHMGPDGYLYFTTSNRDGWGRRGNLARDGDDKIVRVRPSSP